jgi:hypothetical protein
MQLATAVKLAGTVAPGNMLDEHVQLEILTGANSEPWS